MKSLMHLRQLRHPLGRSVLALALGVLPTLARPWPAIPPVAASGTTGAVLTVLAAPVEVATIDSADFSGAVDGQSLRAGDLVRTGTGGLAVLTFFDGSESQLGSESQVQIEQAEATPTPQIALFQTSGVTVNHVVPLPPGGNFRTNTPWASGLVRGTSYVVAVDVATTDAPDATSDSTTGTTQTQTMVASMVLLKDRDGHVGRVDVVSVGSAEPAARLSSAGDAAATSRHTTTTARLDSASLAHMETAANARKDAPAARTADAHAHALTTALAPLLTVASHEAATKPTVVLPTLPARHADSDDDDHRAQPAEVRPSSHELVHTTNPASVTLARATSAVEPGEVAKPTSEAPSVTPAKTTAANPTADARHTSEPTPGSAGSAGATASAVSAGSAGSIGSAASAASTTSAASAGKAAAVSVPPAPVPVPPVAADPVKSDKGPKASTPTPNLR
jgi:hypothetical protein